MNKLFLLLSILTNFSDLYASWVETTLQQMSLQEKIAQLIIPGVRLNYPNSIKQARTWVKKYQVGGLLFVNVGNNFFQSISLTQHLTPCEQALLVQEFQSLCNVPLLIAQDFEWGLSMRLRNTMRFPRAMTLSAMQNENLIYDIAKEIGLQAKAVGVHINFAPVVDINNNAANPVIHDRSFGEDKVAVARKALLFMQGLHDAGVVSCIKHFPGHGDTDVDSHYNLPCLNHSKERLYALELYPFKKLIDAGVPMVMTAHLHIPALDPTENIPATLSSAIITQLLRKQLGFKGIIVTDGLRMRGISNNFTSAEAAARAFLAGNDLLLDPKDPVEALLGVYDAVQKGVINVQEIDDRVRKILFLKHSLGLHSKHREITSGEIIITQHAKELKKEAYRQAITLVRDDKNLLPVYQPNRYAMIDTSTKQKAQKNSILKDLAFNIYSKETPVKKIEEQVVIVPLYGLTRYRQHDYGLENQMQKLFKELIKWGKDVIVIIFGTPYVLEVLPDTISTVLLAYEDEPDAQHAVADVIMGRYVPTGRLPVFCGMQKQK